jgi:hypothetical protein
MADGIVWLARDDVLERDMALKLLPELIILDRAMLSDLKRETKRSLELTHKNIVRTYNFHELGAACGRRPSSHAPLSSSGLIVKFLPKRHRKCQVALSKSFIAQWAVAREIALLRLPLYAIGSEPVGLICFTGSYEVVKFPA